MAYALCLNASNNGIIKRVAFEMSPLQGLLGVVESDSRILVDSVEAFGLLPLLSKLRPKSLSNAKSNGSVGEPLRSLLR